MCELLEAGMFGLIYGSFMIDEEDIVFSKWTQVGLILTEECGTSPPWAIGRSAGMLGRRLDV